MLLILHWLLAKLGLASTMRWLAADSLLVSISPRPSNRSAGKQAQSQVVELSITFLLTSNIAKVSCLISL
jgi:hypothetical protein